MTGLLSQPCKERREEREDPGAKRPGDQKRAGVAKLVGLYGEEQLGKGQPNPWAGEFRVGGWVSQEDTSIGRDWGMLGEPGGQRQLR